MRCHYEVLGVARDADDNEIKRSYRKLALQTHPDKHPEDHQRYTVLFREIQAAYEILSDAQERSWYDKHREAILRGDEEYVDDTLDLMHFFNPGVYSGFGDDDLGFYAVYRSAFQKIAEEDEPFVEEGMYEVPDFGNSTSLFEDVVKPFYGFWLSYCTKKSYVWAEKYDIRQAPNRPTQRLMEKENKKLRDAAKKKRNEEVRALVAFVRKRDKRVHEYRKQLELLQKEQKETTERKRLEILRERQKTMENYQEQDWVAFDNMRNQLEDIEKHFDKEFGEENGESDGEDEHVEHFFCVACDKVFKSEKALANHEKSKKHKENVELIKNEMEDDLVRDLHIESDIDLEALLKEEQDGFKISDISETGLHQAGTLPDVPKAIAKNKDASDAASKDPTFEEYARGVDETTFADNCCDSIRLAKQRKPTRQGSHDFKERKKHSKTEKLVARPSSDDEKCYKDARDLFARDSLALPRKKTSKSKQLRQQAEKRRTEDPDASLGESSACDSLRINKKRGSTKDMGSKPESIDVIAESTSSDGGSSEAEEIITSRVAYQVELSVSEGVQAPSFGPRESAGGEDVVFDTDSNSVALDDQVSFLQPMLGHSPLADSIRIGKEKIVHHGKASLKQKKQKSRDQSSSSDHDQEVIETKSAESEPGRELHLCSVCGKDYPSRNKLFEHIKAERHAAVKEVREKSKRKKGRNQPE